MTRAKLAERAGLSERTIVGLETGRVHRPRIESVRLLADALGLAGPEREAFIAAARGTEPAPVPAAGAYGAGPNLPVVPAQLPADPAGFVGRAGYLRSLDALLPGGPGTSPGAVVVTGTGGVGKTALAVHWAHTVRDRFPDGQLYVTLRGYAPGQPLRPLQALTQLLRGLGVAPEAIPAEPDAAAGLYRTMLSGMRTLVLLDDVPRPRAGPAAAARRPRLPGPHHQPQPAARAGGAQGCPAARAGRALLGGGPDAAGVAARPGPRRRRGGAGRRAGGDVRAPPAAVADRGRQAHRPPTAADRPSGRRAPRGRPAAGLEVPGDQRSAVRATLRLSYASLPAHAGRLFRLLGLVPGQDFTAPAAAALAGLPQPRAGALLERLADANLVASPAPGRFAFHDLLRAYAAERTDAEDAEAGRRAARTRLHDWYLSTADAAARLLYPDKLRLPVPPAAAVGGRPAFDDHDQALAWLDAERPNLVAAAEHAAEHGPQPFAWLRSDTLRGYFWLRMITVDWLVVARAGLAAAQAAGDLPGQAAAELSLGDVHRCQSRYEQAIDHYLRAGRWTREAGWVEGRAAALGNLGNVYWRAGRLTEAAEQHTLALALHRRLGDRDSEADTLRVQAAVACATGDHRDAEELARAALALARDTGTARGHAEEAIALAHQAGYRLPEGQARTTLATLRLRSGQVEEATGEAGQALAIHRETGHRLGEASSLVVLGQALCHTGGPDAARPHWQQALALFTRSGAACAGQVRGLLGSSPPGLPFTPG